MLGELRNQMGLNKSQMASELRVTPSYYTGLESVEKVPSESLARLIEVLWLRERTVKAVEAEAEGGNVAKEEASTYRVDSPWLSKVKSEVAYIDRYGTGTDKRLVLGSVEAVYDDLVARLVREDEGHGEQSPPPPRPSKGGV